MQVTVVRNVQWNVQHVVQKIHVLNVHQCLEDIIN